MLEAIFAETYTHIIGRNNDLPWKDKKYKELTKVDMEHFKNFTKNKNIVMGRKTWESLNKKPLKERGTHIIITSEKKESEIINDINVMYMTLDEFNILYENTKEFVNYVLIGGAKLLDALFDKVTHLSITSFFFHDLESKKEQDIKTPKRILNELNEMQFTLYYDLYQAIGEYTITISKFKRVK